jgi:predicted DNA-binding protein
MTETPKKKKRGSKPHSERYGMFTVYLPERQVAFLDTLGANLGRSRSALVREAIDRTWVPR